MKTSGALSSGSKSSRRESKRVAQSQVAPLAMSAEAEASSARAPFSESAWQPESLLVGPLKLLRRAAEAAALPVAYSLVPIKTFAWSTQVLWLRRLLLEATSFADWSMVFATVQNPAMRISQAAFGGGNFFFGRAVMITEHEKAEREVQLPTLRTHHFMGVDVVHNDPAVFSTNAGMLTTAPPVRTVARKYIDDVVMNQRVRDYDLSSLKTSCETILREWQDDPKMATMFSIRGAATRIFLAALADKTLPKDFSDDITVKYIRCFGESSLLQRYFPTLMAVIGTHDRVRRDVYIPLRKLGIDNMIIDMTMFAAMFSVGTIVMKAIEFIAENEIDYPHLDERQRMTLVIEAQRLCPTVTSVHRVVEEEETVDVAGKTIKLRPGDEVVYPFICINRDPTRFSNPEAFRLDRPRAEMEAVLSWSKGPHNCPARDLSILATITMLDALAERFDLRALRILNLEF